MTARPGTAYDGNPRVVWDGDSGWDVTCCPGDGTAPIGRVELFIGADGMEAESFWVSGNDPERQQHGSPDEALARFLGAPQ